MVHGSLGKVTIPSFRWICETPDIKNIKSIACSDSFNQGSVCNATCRRHHKVRDLRTNRSQDCLGPDSSISNQVNPYYGNQFNCGSDGWKSITGRGLRDGTSCPWTVLVLVWRYEDDLSLNNPGWGQDEDEHFRPSFRSLIPGIKIRGFLGDYCIRTRCPTIKTRHVELLFIYSTFCSTLCVLTLCCIGRVAVHLFHLRKDLVLPC